LAWSGFGCGAEEVSFGVVDERVAAGEDAERGESLQASGYGGEMRSAGGDGVGGGPIEAGDGSVEATVG